MGTCDDPDPTTSGEEFPSGPGGPGVTAKECDLATLFGDPGSYFFDNTAGKTDPILGFRPGIEHSHLYGSPSDNSVGGNIYYPTGGKIVSPNTTVPGNSFLGSSRNKAGIHNANYILVQYDKLGGLSNVTLAIFHIDEFKPSLQPDGRTKVGKIGFSGAEKFGSGGALGRMDGKKGGHSHFELLKGKKWNLSKKRLLNFGDICK